MKKDYFVVGRAEQVLLDFESESIDFCITSPPYDDLRDYNGYALNFPALASELYRVLKTGSVLVWVVGDRVVKTGGESGSSFRQALHFMDLGFKLHDTMIYQKSGPSYPEKTRYYQVFEYMFVFCKGKHKTNVFNPIKDRKNRWHGQKWSKVRSRRLPNGELKFQTWYQDEGDEFGVRFNVWKYMNGHGYHGDEFCHEHPASFPEKLAEDHILSWTNPGDLVLDPLCGSGTSCKMAVLNDRHYIGIDVSEEYIELSKRRLKAASKQLELIE